MKAVQEDAKLIYRASPTKHCYGLVSLRILNWRRLLPLVVGQK
jgi:hypothetical protein